MTNMDVIVQIMDTVKSRKEKGEDVFIIGEDASYNCLEDAFYNNLTEGWETQIEQEQFDHCFREIVDEGLLEITHEDDCTIAELTDKGRTFLAQQNDPDFTEVKEQIESYCVGIECSLKMFMQMFHPVWQMLQETKETDENEQDKIEATISFSDYPKSYYLKLAEQLDYDIERILNALYDKFIIHIDQNNKTDSSNYCIDNPVKTEDDKLIYEYLQKVRIFGGGMLKLDKKVIQALNQQHPNAPFRFWKRCISKQKRFLKALKKQTVQRNKQLQKEQAKYHEEQKQELVNTPLFDPDSIRFILATIANEQTKYSTNVGCKIDVGRLLGQQTYEGDNVIKGHYPSYYVLCKYIASLGLATPCSSGSFDCFEGLTTKGWNILGNAVNDEVWEKAKKATINSSFVIFTKILEELAMNEARKNAGL